jgi:hypothetical protein
MTRARSSGARGRIAKIAVAGVLIGIPIAAVSVPAYAAPAGTPTVLPAPLPADPPTIAPAPPSPQVNYNSCGPAWCNPADYPDDWWGWGGDPGGGGGGG